MTMEILHKLGGAISAITGSGVDMGKAVLIIALPQRQAFILCHLIEREVRAISATDANPFKFEPGQVITWRGAEIRVEIKPGDAA